jgi:hypothetical protein
MRAALALLVSAGIGVLPACAELGAQGGAGAASPQSSMGGARSTQIIIKFRDPRTDASHAHVVDEIGRDAGARLIYVRPMSGGAHVLRLEDPVDGAELDRIVGRLGKRQDVEYVEPDRPMRHMRGTTQ